MSNSIIPEIVGQTEILEESPMTEQEQKELIETETVIKSSFQGKMERDLAIGAALLKIKRRSRPLCACWTVCPAAGYGVVSSNFYQQ